MDLAELRKGAKEGIVPDKTCLMEACDNDCLEGNELCRVHWAILLEQCNEDGCERIATYFRTFEDGDCMVRESYCIAHVVGQDLSAGEFKIVKKDSLTDKQIDDVTCRARSCVRERKSDRALCTSCLGVFNELEEAVSLFHKQEEENKIDVCLTDGCNKKTVLYLDKHAFNRCHDHSAIANGDVEKCKELGCWDPAHDASDFCFNHDIPF